MNGLWKQLEDDASALLLLLLLLHRLLLFLHPRSKTSIFVVASEKNESSQVSFLVGIIWDGEERKNEITESTAEIYLLFLS